MPENQSKEEQVKELLLKLHECLTDNMSDKEDHFIAAPVIYSHALIASLTLLKYYDGQIALEIFGAFLGDASTAGFSVSEIKTSEVSDVD